MYLTVKYQHLERDFDTECGENRGSKSYSEVVFHCFIFFPWQLQSGVDFRENAGKSLIRGGAKWEESGRKGMLPASRQLSQGSFAVMWQKEMKTSGRQGQFEEKFDDTEGLGIMLKRCP